jgi:hypothetical protein
MLGAVMGLSPELEELLQPSLQEGQLRKPPYSVRSGFFVSFFGGMLTAVSFAALNSKRTERVGRDAPWLAVLAAVGLAWPIWAGYAEATDSIPTWLTSFGDPDQGMKVLGRALGLLGFGLIYWLQRDMHETRDLRGQEPPSAWVPGIVTLLVAGGVQFVLTWVGNSLGKS